MTIAVAARISATSDSGTSGCEAIPARTSEAPCALIASSTKAGGGVEATTSLTDIGPIVSLDGQQKGHRCNLPEPCKRAFSRADSFLYDTFANLSSAA